MLFPVLMYGIAGLVGAIVIGGLAKIFLKFSLSRWVTDVWAGFCCLFLGLSAYGFYGNLIVGLIMAIVTYSIYLYYRLDTTNIFRKLIGLLLIIVACIYIISILVWVFQVFDFFRFFSVSSRVPW